MVHKHPRRGVEGTPLGLRPSAKSGVIRMRPGLTGSDRGGNLFLLSFGVQHGRILPKWHAVRGRFLTKPSRPCRSVAAYLVMAVTMAMQWIPETSTGGHTHTHTHDENRKQEQSKKSGERKLLRSCRAALDVFRSGSKGGKTHIHTHTHTHDARGTNETTTKKPSGDGAEQGRRSQGTGLQTSHQTVRRMQVMRRGAFRKK